MCTDKYPGSEAPSYHSTVPQAHESIPPYIPDRHLEPGGPAERIEVPITPPPQTSNNTGDHTLEAVTPQQDVNNVPERSPTRDRLSPAPLQTVRPVGVPPLAQFKIPTWSTISANPTARHYHNVAQRRAQTHSDPVEKLRRNLTQQALMDEEEAHSRNFRPLEDPYLVGEVAARQAKALRLMRENGDDILVREDRRWDWFQSMYRRSPQTSVTMG